MADPTEVARSFSVFAWCTFSEVRTSTGTPGATPPPETGVSVTAYVRRRPLETGIAQVISEALERSFGGSALTGERREGVSALSPLKTLVVERSAQVFESFGPSPSDSSGLSDPENRESLFM